MDDMTTITATEPAAAVETPVPTGGPIRFLGSNQAYWRLLVRGGVLLLLTLGLYRFWLATDVRRFLWVHTEIADHTLEYTGSALELLLGFLIAVAILVPLYSGFFFLALEMGIIGKFTGVIAFAVLAVLGQFAIYRARRYRLTRTVYRGIRFHQTGSAWRYALNAAGWWSVVLLTLGLAYPWAQASLERFKMNNTYYGDLPGGFEGSAVRLFLRGILMWLIVMGPFGYGIVMIFQSIDWAALSDAAAQSGDDFLGRVEGSNPNLAAAFVTAAIAVGWAVAAAALLYPIFQAMVLRWWSGGLRFGTIEMRSRLRTTQVYGVYLRFVSYAIVFVLVAGIVGTIELTAIAALGGIEQMSSAGQIAITGLLVGTYVIVALAFSTIYQATVKFSLWRLGMHSLDMTNLDALERVRAVGRASSPVGEGLADALNVGGF
jgi:uncharacterized membrane protein YjgN (DUF898 family)